MKNHVHIHTALGVLAILVLVTASQSHAETIYRWNPTDSENLNSAANWDPAGVPGSNDAVEIVDVGDSASMNADFAVENFAYNRGTANSANFQLNIGASNNTLFTLTIGNQLLIGNGARASRSIAIQNGSGRNRDLALVVQGSTEIHRSTLRLGNNASENESANISSFNLAGTVHLHSDASLWVANLLGAGAFGSMEFYETDSIFNPISGSDVDRGVINGGTNTITIARLHSVNAGAGVISGDKIDATLPTIGHLVIDGSENGDFSGVISDGLPNNQIRLTLAESNTQTQTLSGTNTYTGNTDILGGVLHLGKEASLSTREISFQVADAAHGQMDISNKNYTFENGNLTLFLRGVTGLKGSWKLFVGDGFSNRTLDLASVKSDLAGLEFVRSGRTWSGAASGKRWTFDESNGLLSVVPGN